MNPLAVRATPPARSSNWTCRDGAARGERGDQRVRGPDRRRFRAAMEPLMIGGTMFKAPTYMRVKQPPQWSPPRVESGMTRAGHLQSAQFIARQ